MKIKTFWKNKIEYISIPLTEYHNLKHKAKQTNDWHDEINKLMDKQKQVIIELRGKE